MKIGISVLIFIFSNIYVSMGDLTNVTTSFIQPEALFSYFQELSDDFAATLLQQALVAASVNRNLFNIAEAISADCQRTAKAMADMYQELAIVVQVDKVIRRSSQKAISTLKSSSSPSNPVEFICKSLERDIRTFLVLYPEFEYLKKIARISQISGPPYYSKIPKSPVQAAEIFFRQVTDLQVAQIVSIGVFVDHAQSKSGSDIKYVKTAKAIMVLAKRADLVGATQGLYTKTVTKISKEAIADTQKENLKRKSSIQFISFFVNLYRKKTLESLDQAFSEDSMLKNEYKNAMDGLSLKSHR